MSRRLKLAATLLTVALGLSGGIPAQATHDESDHSDNVKLLAQVPLIVQKDDPKTTDVDEEVVGQLSDLAFQGNLLIAGDYAANTGGIGFFKILKHKPYLKQLSHLDCAGRQADVSVYGDLVFMSVDSPREDEKCGSPEKAGSASDPDASGWEGIRIISIENVRRPVQVGTIRTACGSHTHTIVPDKKNLFIYIESYPINSQSIALPGTDDSFQCNAASHEKISVAKVPLANPAAAKVIGTPDVSPSIGCHDVTAYPKKHLAAAACISESQIWDIKNPAEPKILAHITNPAIDIHHSSAFTWDGKYIALGDEAGAAETNECKGTSDNPKGAMWFYDISDPTNPQMTSSISLPRIPPTSQDQDGAPIVRCTTHNFNILPMKDPKKYEIVSAYYIGGFAAIDFSDPAAPVETAHYVPIEGGLGPEMWSCYWYNGRIYCSDFETGRGVSVFKMKGTGRRKVKYFKGRLNVQTQLPSFK